LIKSYSLIQLELSWWKNNRSLNVTSPLTNKTYEMFRYSVSNTAPRPESYLTGMSSPRALPFTLHILNSLLDYLTANDPTLATPLTESQRSELYSELASGAETGKSSL